MALHKMVQVGDSIKDRNGDVWTITSTLNGIASYSRPMKIKYGHLASQVGDSAFLAAWDPKYTGELVFSQRFTLVP